MTTQNAINVGLSGATGSGNFVGSNTPSITTPNIVTGLYDANNKEMIGFSPTASAANFPKITNATAGNSPIISADGTDTNIALTLQGKGNLGINLLGISTNTAASAGYVGENINSVVNSPGNSISQNIAADITSISLTAGEWTVFGTGGITYTGVTNPNFYFWVSTASASQPSSFASQAGSTLAVTNGSFTTSHVCPYFRGLFSTTTTVYLSVRSNWSSATSATAFGAIYAIRVR